MVNIIQPSAEILFPVSKEQALGQLRLLERAGRTCYKSEDRISDDSWEKFLRMIVERGHEAMIEHASATVRFVTDRGVTHELVRHRIASFAQESTRYCRYSKDKFGSEITVVEPPFEHEDPGVREYMRRKWFQSVRAIEGQYMELLKAGAPPQLARSVLPNSLKAEICVTANLREWRYILKLRGVNKRAHPQIREIMTLLLPQMQEYYPVLFED